MFDGQFILEEITKILKVESGLTFEKYRKFGRKFKKYFTKDDYYDTAHEKTSGDVYTRCYLVFGSYFEAQFSKIYLEKIGVRTGFSTKNV